MTLLKFEGIGPFSLPPLQSTTATAQGENVQMVLRVRLGGEWQSTRVQMLQKVADALASQLPEASKQARGNERKA